MFVDSWKPFVGVAVKELYLNYHNMDITTRAGCPGVRGLEV